LGVVSITVNLASTTPVATGVVATMNGTSGTCSLVTSAQYSCTWNIANGVVPIFQVFGTSANGNSGPANFVGSALSGYSSAPQNASASVVTGGSVKVQWSYPDNDGSAVSSGKGQPGSSPITQFTVTSVPASNGCAVAGTSTDCTVTGITNGVSYVFTVTAVNQYGSDATFSAVSTLPVISGAATALTAATSSGAATVSWTAAVGFPNASYIVTSTPGSLTCQTSTTTCTVSGLSNGTSYTFVVKTVISANSSASSQPSTAVVPATKPDPVTAVATTLSDTSVLITFAAPAFNGGSPIVQFVATASPGGQSCSTALQAGTNTYSCTISGLTEGTTYTFSVVAQNMVNGAVLSSTPVVSASVTPAPIPDAPSNVSASPGDGLAVVSWNTPPSYGQVITGYTVTATPGDASCTTTTTSCVVQGLTNGTAYSFAVIATDSAGPSAAGYSASIAPINPYAATNVRATIATTTSGTTIVATWSALGTTKQGTTTYTLSAVPTSGATLTCSTQTTMCVFTGATPNMTYTVSLVATLVGLVIRPTATAAIPATSTALTWLAAQTPYGMTLSGYQVSSTPVVTPPATCSNTTALSCTFTGLTAGTAYSFSVVPSYTASLSASTSVAPLITATASQGSTSVTLSSTNTIVAGMSIYGAGIAQGCTVLSVNSTTKVITISSATTAALSAQAIQFASTATATIAWDAPGSVSDGSSITGYTVTSTPALSAPAACVNILTFTCLFTGLVNGVSYSFSVTAVFGSGRSATSLTSKQAVVPTQADAPGTPSTTPGDKSVTVTWSASNQRGSAITSYTVTSSPGGFTCTASMLQFGPTNCVVTGLQNATSYTFSVTALNAVGTSMASPSSIATTPGSVSNVVASIGYQRSIVSWTPSPQTSPISRYVVTSSPGNITCTTTGTWCTVLGLTNGTAYTFTVSSSYASGLTAVSLPSSPTTPTTTVPDAPSAVVGTQSSHSATITWTIPVSDGGSSITRYLVTASDSSISPCELPVDSTTTVFQCVLTGLTNGVAYTFTVSAVNVLGIGAPSLASSPITPISAPSAPTSVTSVTSGSNMVISWTAAQPQGSPVTGYRVTASADNYPDLTCTSQSLSCTLTGAQLGIVYSVIVVATNAVGDSLPSVPGSAVVAIAPSAPLNVIGLAGNTNAIVTWSAPSTLGGIILSSYSATAYTSQGTIAGTCQATSIDGVQNAATSCLIAGLSNGVAYTFKVTATNAIGTSPQSTVSVAVVPLSIYLSPGTILLNSVWVSQIASTALSGIQGTGKLTFGASLIPVSLSYVSASSWSYTSSGSASLFGQSSCVFNTTGTVSASSATSASGSISLSLSAPCTVNGVRFAMMQLTLSASGVLSGSGTVVVAGSTLNVQLSSYASAVSWQLDLTANQTLSLGGGLNMTGISGSVLAGQVLAISGSANFGGLQLAGSLQYSSAGNWTLIPTPFSTVSLFSPAVTSQYITGSIIDTAGTVSGSWSAAMGSVALGGNSIDSFAINFLPTGLLGASGSIIIDGSSGSTVSLSTLTYLSANSWTLGLTASSLNLSGVSFTQVTGSIASTSSNVILSAQLSLATTATVGVTVTLASPGNWTMNIASGATLSLFSPVTSLGGTGTVSSSGGVVSGQFVFGNFGLQSLNSALSLPSLNVSWDAVSGLVGTGSGVVVYFTSATTWNLDTTGLPAVLSGSITLGNFSLSNLVAQALVGTYSAALTVAGVVVNVMLTYGDQNNWTLSVTGSPSFFSAVFTGNGSATDTAGLITGSLTMSAASVLIGGLSISSASITVSPSGVVS